MSTSQQERPAQIEVAAQPQAPEAPYRGLEPFRFVDNGIFFARGKEVRKLLRYVIMYRGVLFYGDSGSGKSSLINAGLIPALLEEGFTPDRVRVQPRRGEELIVERIPTGASVGPRYLPSNFSADEGDGPSARIVLPADALKERIEKLPHGQRPILIFDQFEELVTLFEEAPRGASLTETLEFQNNILDVLVGLLADHSVPVKLLFVFREDYLAKLTKFFARSPDLPDHYLRLTAPEQRSLSEIINGPFEKFPGLFGNELSPELASALTTEIVGDGGSHLVNLSEVQIVCLELWQSKDPHAMLAQRKVAGILEEFLSKELDGLPAELRDPAVALLRRMVTASGTRNVISEDDLLYLTAKEEKVSAARLKSALEALVNDTKLVRRERRQNTIFYQIVSEFLVPWIIRQKAERQARLVRRRAYRYIGFSLLLAAAMAGFAWWVYSTRTEAVLQKQVVQAALADKAEAEKRVAELVKENEKLRRILNDDASKADINSLYNQIDGLKQELQAANGEKQRLNTVISNLEPRAARADEMDKTLSEKDAEIKTLRAGLDTARGLVEVGGTAIDVARHDLKAANDENNKLTAEVRRLTGELNDLKSGRQPTHTAEETGPSTVTDKDKPPAEATGMRLEVNIFSDKFIKTLFGERIRDRFHVLHVAFFNKTGRDVIVNDLAFRPTAGASLLRPFTDLASLLSLTHDEQFARLVQGLYRGNLIVPNNNQVITYVLIPKAVPVDTQTLNAPVFSVGLIDRQTPPR